MGFESKSFEHSEGEKPEEEHIEEKMFLDDIFETEPEESVTPEAPRAEEGGGNEREHGSRSEFNEFIETMEVEEERALEQCSSRFKKALLGLTAGAALMMGAGPSFVGAEELRAMAEKGSVSMEEEKSAEEIRLSQELISEGYAESAVEEFVLFVWQEGVSFPDLLIVKEKKSADSDTLMLLKAYAVAAGAVGNGRLSGDMADRFREHVLPHLKNGHVDVIRMAKDDMKGSEALYDGKRDAYIDTDIDLSSYGDHAIAIHELVHLSQDSMELTQMRQDSEYEAYRTGAEYVLSRGDVFHRDTEGFVMFSRSVDMASVPTEYEKIIIYEAALHNAEQGKNELNTIIDGDIDCAALGAEDAIAWYGEQIRSLREMIDMVWASSTDISGIVSGKMIDTKETLIKDGIRRHNEAQ